MRNAGQPGSDSSRGPDSRLTWPYVYRNPAYFPVKFTP